MGITCYVILSKQSGYYMPVPQRKVITDLRSLKPFSTKKKWNSTFPLKPAFHVALFANNLRKNPHLYLDHLIHQSNEVSGLKFLLRIQKIYLFIHKSVKNIAVALVNSINCNRLCKVDKEGRHINSV